LLTLETTAYEPKDNRRELGQSHWLAYVLDNFKSVPEAVDALEDNKEFRIIPAMVPEKGVTGIMSVHLALEDPTGDSAVFELVNGKMVIHHGPQYQVMTNDPSYDTMLQRLKKYKAFGGKLGLPGEGPEGEYRFVRLAAYYKLLPDPKSYRDAVANAISLMRVAQVPSRDPNKELEATENATDADRLWAGGVQTNWLSAIDVSHKVYYVNSARSPDFVLGATGRSRFERRRPRHVSGPARHHAGRRRGQALRGVEILGSMTPPHGPDRVIWCQ
jgi:choloylglycine hydrolase